jgi:hypothetical protein
MIKVKDNSFVYSYMKAEKTRIVRAGGVIEGNRVVSLNGFVNMNLSRALGDPGFKGPGMKPENCIVTGLVLSSHF